MTKEQHSATLTERNQHIQKKYRNWRILRNHSGAIWVHQAGGHSISHYDSGRWSGSDFSIKQLLRIIEPDQGKHFFWFSTPKKPGKTEDHTSIQTQNFRELHESREKEKLKSKDEVELWVRFLERFGWTNTLLTKIDKHAVGDILVEYHDLFASHKMDIGMNTEFKMRLTPKAQQAFYSQSLPMPIHLENYLFVEFALMHKYGFITILPFSNYKRPIFAHRKPNGKLRLFVDLRKINTLIADDLTINNHPVSNLSNAANHLAWKCLLYKLDCCQA